MANSWKEQKKNDSKCSGTVLNFSFELCQREILPFKGIRLLVLSRLKRTQDYSQISIELFIITSKRLHHYFSDRQCLALFLIQSLSHSRPCWDHQGSLCMQPDTKLVILSWSWLQRSGRPRCNKYLRQPCTASPCPIPLPSSNSRHLSKTFSSWRSARTLCTCRFWKLCHIVLESSREIDPVARKCN